MTGDPVSEEQPQSLLLVVRGTPSDEELAGMTAVTALAATSAADDAPARPRVAWGDPARRLRTPLHPGHGV